MCVHKRIANAQARSGTRTVFGSWASSFLHSTCLNLFLVSFISILETFLIFTCRHVEVVHFLLRSHAYVFSSKRPLYFQRIIVVSG